MSYDYASSNARLELPNPYRVQNLLLFLCAALSILAGLWALWRSRADLNGLSILIGLVLVAAGIVCAGSAAQRLRFFFGRGRPASLAPELQAQTEGSSPAAKYFQQILRDGALVYPEPKGPVEGVLYHAVPNLITAPLAIQRQAKVHFGNAAALLITLLSFVVAYGMFGTEQTRPWLAGGYFAFGALFLMRPVMRADPAPLAMGTLLALVVVAILGPTVLTKLLAQAPQTSFSWSLAPQTTVLLLTALVGVGLTMAAVVAQVQAPPPTHRSAEQMRLSLNVPPGLLMDELERTMQEQWAERIPNRRYALSIPAIDPALHSGAFAGELLEESQPLPMDGMTPSSLKEALHSERHRWTAVLDLFASALLCGSVVCAWMALQLQAGEQSSASQVMSWTSSAAILMLVSAFCFKSSALLWGRFDFHSTLTWVEMSGTYQTAQMGTGNAMTSRMQTQNQIVRTEAMTLRVWRARLESVVFGKDSARWISAMHSTDLEARELAQHLMSFGQSRSAMVAPESAADLAKMQTLGGAEQVLVGSDESAQLLTQAASPLAAAIGHAAEPAAAAPSPAGRFCHHCGAALPAQARFCPACGTSQS